MKNIKFIFSGLILLSVAIAVFNGCGRQDTLDAVDADDVNNSSANNSSAISSSVSSSSSQDTNVLQIISLTATPATILTNADSTIECTVSNPTGGNLFYSYSMTGGGGQKGEVVGDSNFATYTAPLLTNSYIIKADVSNDTGEVASEFVTVTVTN